MNTRFYTPSFGDEEFNLTDVDAYTMPTTNQATTTTTNVNNMVENQSQRVRDMNISHNLQVTKPITILPQSAPMEPVEPRKPLSAYALFFKDTVRAIKQQNPDATFHELTRIAASMWEPLDALQKSFYHCKSESLRADYLKDMAVYRQQLLEIQERQQAAFLQPSTSAMQMKSTEHTIPRSSAVATTMPKRTLPPRVTSTVTSATATAAIDTNVQKPTTVADVRPQMQLLTEAGSAQKCARDSCTKRAIINPDWEDEYCSNECVVIHCRNVFNAWVRDRARGEDDDT